MFIIPKNATDAEVVGMFQAQIQKHAQHDQQDHGNWADASTTPRGTPVKTKSKKRYSVIADDKTQTWSWFNSNNLQTARQEAREAPAIISSRAGSDDAKWEDTVVYVLDRETGEWLK